MAARLACTLAVVALALSAGTAAAQPAWQRAQDASPPPGSAPQQPAQRPPVELRTLHDVFLAIFNSSTDATKKGPDS